MENIISRPLLTFGVFSLKRMERSVSPFHKHQQRQLSSLHYAYREQNALVYRL